MQKRNKMRAYIVINKIEYGIEIFTTLKKIIEKYTHLNKNIIYNKFSRLKRPRFEDERIIILKQNIN